MVAASQPSNGGQLWGAGAYFPGVSNSALAHCQSTGHDIFSYIILYDYLNY